MGGIKPSGGRVDEDEDPEDPAGSVWKQLLDENDTVYSLKPWEEILEMKANKANIAFAFREIMRQAWGEYNSTFDIYSYLTLII